MIKKIICIGLIMLTIPFTLYARGQKNQEESSIKMDFHQEINKDKFEKVSIMDMINKEYLNKYVSIQGEVYTHIIDSYGNFKFKAFDATGEVDCYWYSTDKQESKNMFSELEKAQIESSIADEYYNVIIYGEYKENPEKVGEYNIFVHDIEFPSVQLEDDATLGGIPIWGNEDDNKGEAKEEENITDYEEENDNEESSQSYYIGGEKITSLSEFEELVQREIDNNSINIGDNKIDELNMCKDLIKLWTSYGYVAEVWTSTISVETEKSYIDYGELNAATVITYINPNEEFSFKNLDLEIKSIETITGGNISELEGHESEVNHLLNEKSYDNHISTTVGDNYAYIYISYDDEKDKNRIQIDFSGYNTGL